MHRALRWTGGRSRGGSWGSHVCACLACWRPSWSRPWLANARITLFPLPVLPHLYTVSANLSSGSHAQFPLQAQLHRGLHPGERAWHASFGSWQASTRSIGTRVPAFELARLTLLGSHQGSYEAAEAWPGLALSCADLRPANDALAIATLLQSHIWQAKKTGADEALMLDPHGFVATCNSVNFFIVRKVGVLDGALEMRQRRSRGKSGLPVMHRPQSPGPHAAVTMCGTRRGRCGAPPASTSCTASHAATCSGCAGQLASLPKSLTSASHR